MKKPGIRFSLSLLALACTLPIAVMAAFVFLHYYEREQVEISNTAVSRARAMASSIDKEFASTEAALHALLTSPFLAKDDIAGFHAQATQALANIGAIQILLFDGAEQMLFTTQRQFGERLPEAPTPPALKRLFESHRPGVSDLFLGRVVQHPVFVVTVPVKRGGATVYYLNASFDPARLAHVLTEQKFPGTWRATITDSTGSVAARTHDIAKFLGRRITPNLLERMRVANEGAFESKTLDGIPVLTVFSRSPVSKWTVVVGMPLDEVTAGLRRTLTGLIVATSVALALGLGLAWFVGSRVARSFSALVGPARALGSGAALTIPELHIKEAHDVGNALQDAAAALSLAKHASHHDSLTGLPNRVLFQILVNRQLALCQRNKSRMAILYIDLDGFKAVNDTQGHAAGDELLRAVSLRMKQGIRDSDTAARLGGDEFAVALVDCDVESAKTIAGKLIHAISEPYSHGANEARISASIGIAVYPEAGTDCDTLLIRADKAMYAAKTLGKRRFSVSAPA